MHRFPFFDLQYLVELENELQTHMNSEELQMSRKPLPDDFDANAFGQGDLIHRIHDQLGIPLRELIMLDPQALYDLVKRHLAPEERDEFERVVVIDDETARQLKRNMRQMLRRARPGKRKVPHDIGVTSRTIALSHLPHVPQDASLHRLETELVAAGSEPQVLVEDADYDDYGKDMNRIISRRPHGRSRKLDKGSGACCADFDTDMALDYLFALIALINEPSWAHGGLEPRRVVLAYASENDETDFALRAETAETDLIVLFFEPGEEHKGPSNIAVYAQRSGTSKAWAECSVWGFAQESGYLIASDEGEFGFIIWQCAILFVRDIPSEDLPERFVEGTRRLHEMIGEGSS